jgi:hypothetical protein
MLVSEFQTDHSNWIDVDLNVEEEPEYSNRELWQQLYAALAELAPEIEANYAAHVAAEEARKAAATS